MRRRILLAFAVSIAVAIFVFSMLPESRKVHTTGIRLYPLELANGRILFVNPHRIAHWLAFGAVTLAFGALARSPRQRLAIAAGVMLFACAIELAEAATYRIGFELYDVRDDVIGVFAALILIQFAAAVRRRT